MGCRPSKIRADLTVSGLITGGKTFAMLQHTCDDHDTGYHQSAAAFADTPEVF